MDILCKSLESSKNLVVKHSENRGRFFIAAKDFNEDDILIKEEPYAASVYVPELKCDWCYEHVKSGKLNFKCHGCNKMFYCSRKCKDAAVYHKGIECEIYKKFDSSKIDDANMICAVTLAIRILALRAQEKEINPEFKYLYANIIFMNDFDLEYQQEVQDLFDETTTYLMSLGNGKEFMGVSEQDLLDILLRYYSNSFGLWDEGEWSEDSNCIGIGIYLKACFFNHSCSPNVKAVRDTRALIFKTTEDIKKGDELCISYIDPSLPKKQRQAELMSEFSFLCNCVTCEAEPDEPEKKKKKKKV